MGKKSSGAKTPTEPPELPVRQLCELADAILDLAELIERCGFVVPPVAEAVRNRQVDIGEISRHFLSYPRPEKPAGTPAKVRHPVTDAVMTFRPKSEPPRLRWPLTDEECRLKCVLWATTDALYRLENGQVDPDREADVPNYLRGLAEGIRPRRKPLSPNAAAVYSILLDLEPHRALTGEELLKRLSSRKDNPLFLDIGTLSSRHLPELYPYGLTNQPRIGYSILPRHRPKQNS